MGVSEADITLDLSEDNLDGNTFSDSLDFKMKPAADPEYRLLDVFFHLNFLPRPFTNHRAAGRGEGISLTHHYHFHPLHRHLDISQAITAESPALHIGSSRTRTGNLCFPSASRCHRHI